MPHCKPEWGSTAKYRCCQCDPILEQRRMLCGHNITLEKGTSFEVSPGLNGIVIGRCMSRQSQRRPSERGLVLRCLSFPRRSLEKAHAVGIKGGQSHRLDNAGKKSRRRLCRDGVLAKSASDSVSRHEVGQPAHDRKASSDEKGVLEKSVHDSKYRSYS
jgi:hypothetical protein